MFLHPVSSDRNPHQPKLFDRALYFFDRRVHILKWYEPYPFEARTFGADACDPVVIAAAICGRIIFFRKERDAKTAGWKKDRDIDLLRIHVPQTRRYIRNVQTELSIHTRIPLIAREQRPLSPAVRFFHEFPDVGITIANVTVGIDNFDISEIHAWHEDLLPP